MKRTADINEILKPLKDTPYQAYLSNAVQVADILDWILSQVGIAEIWQTSFSISEEFRHSCISPWQYNHVIQRS